MLWIIVSIAILLILITVHELGHFIAGKLLGFSIMEFSIGFGPAIFSKIGKDGVKYSIRLLPLGGYCAFDNESEADGAIKFNDQKPWKKLVVLLSGVAMNIVFAFLLCMIMFAGFGSNKVVVNSVSEGTPAENMGIMQGDIVEEIDGKTVDSFNISSIIQKSGNDRVEVIVDRDEKKIVLENESLYNPTSDNYSLGIIAESGDAVKLSAIKITTYSFTTLKESSGAILGAFKGLVTRPSENIDNMSGPIGTVSQMSGLLGGIYDETGDFSVVISIILSISILISTNLAIFNLFPIPGLDGGTIIMTVLEMIIRRPIPDKVKGAINFIGFALILLLFLMLTTKDISTIVG